MIEQSSSGNQLKLMKYLDELSKQMSNRKSSGVLQQHLSSLSKAYDQAQQKLLQTEKALMIESVLLEKQRSVIGYYKDVLNEEMDEDGILYFLQQLEEDQSNRQIYDDIVDLRNIVNRKKVKSCKRQYQDEKSIKQLKKQVARLNQQNRDAYQQSQKANTTLNDITQNNMKLSEQLQENRQRMSRALQKAKFLEQENCRLKRDNQLYEHQVRKISSLTSEMNAKETQLKELKRWKEQLESFLKDKLHLQVDNQQNISKNSNKPKQKNANQTQRSKQTFFTIEKKLNQLLKYKTQYKKMKDNSQQFQFLKREVSLLKLFISQQALELIKQFELQKMDCVQTEIRNLAVLEKGRHIKLEECEREVWKYKIQLLRQQDSCALQNSTHTMPSYPRNKLNSSKCSNIIQTFRATQQPEIKTALNLSIADKISQFQS